MKRILLICSMIVCMFALGACGDAAETTGLTDDSAKQVQTQAQALIEKMVSLDDATLEQYEEYYAPDGVEPDEGLYNGLLSWSTAKEEAGAYKSMENAVVTLTDKGAYSVAFTAAFEHRTVEIKAELNKRGDTWEVLSFNPVYSLGEKMGQAGMNTLMGMMTVFILLIIMTLCISCFKYISKVQEKFKKKPEPVVSPVSEPVPAVVEEEEDLSDDLELAAVIAAAIAAAEDVPAEGLIVRSIRRVNTNKWKRA